MKLISIVNSWSKRKRTLLVLGSLFLFASCIAEKWADTDGGNGAQEVGVTIRMKINAGGNSTRGLTDNEEGRVDDVFVFFMNADTKKVHSVVKGINVTDLGNTKTFTANLSVVGNGAERYDCIVIANIESWMQDKNLQSFKGLSYPELQKQLVSMELTHATQTTQNGNIVMWGETASPFLASKPENIQVVMIRALARVDIGVGRTNGSTWDGKDQNGNKIPFDLTEVYIYKPNNAYSFMPEELAYSPDLSRVLAPSPAGNQREGAFRYEVTNSYSRQEIYIPESDVVGTLGIVGDENHWSRCAVVVGGLYDNATYYYRIDFRQGADLINVLRNHNYRISITSVGGVGEATPDEAYKSKNVGLTVDIVNWTDQYQDVIFDGVNWVFCENKNLVFPYQKGVCRNLKIESNVDWNEWEVSVDNVNWSKMPDANVPITDSTGFFEIQSVANGLYICTKEDYLQDDSSNNRQSMLWFRIKRLKFEITLKQEREVPEEWVDGGEIDKEV